MRSPFYGLALMPLLALKSEWPIVFAQAATAAALIFLVLRTVIGPGAALALSPAARRAGAADRPFLA